MKIAVMLPNWIGDVVMATPALRALRRHFRSEATITGIMRPYVQQVLEGTRWLDHQVLYERRRGGSELGMRQTARQLRQQGFDVLLLMTNSLSTAWFGWQTRIRRRIGFGGQLRDWLLTERLSVPRSDGRIVPRSAVEHYVDLVQALGIEKVERRVELATTAADDAAAERVWQRFHLNAADRVVLLNTGGAFGASKRWPNESFARLAQQLAEKDNTAVLVLCGPAERDDAATIATLAGHPRVHSLAALPPDLGLSKACVRRADLMITTDSGPRHFAAAFQVPVMTLFGPTDPRWSHNYHSGEHIIRLDLACSPCDKPRCPLKHHDCMRQLTPQQVLHQALGLIDSGHSKLHRARGVGLA